MDFLLLEDLEALYGGAAGGGKSDALLMAALMYVDVPGYNAIIFRRTLADHQLPEGLIPRAQEWMADARGRGFKSKWKGGTSITFPSMATLTFGYMRQPNDHWRYQSSAYQSISFDELSQFMEKQYLYMFSRLRRLQGVNIPLRVRSGSNPGGIGHEWVKERFIPNDYKKMSLTPVYYKDVVMPDQSIETVTFIPAKLQENIYLDREQYEKTLAFLDPVTRLQLLEGDWEVYEGGMFDRRWFPIVKAYPANMVAVRYWDKAATTKKKSKYTAGGLMATPGDGTYYILDMVRFKGTSLQVEKTIKQTAVLDQQLADQGDLRMVQIYMEQEPGSSGIDTTSNYQRNILKGFAFYPDRPTGSKETRAAPLASAAEAQNVFMLQGSWNRPCLVELEGFPEGEFKDQTDCLSGAFNMLHKMRRRPQVA